MERLERIELGLGRQAEVLPFNAVQRLREVLDDGADREGAQRAVAGRPVARPAGGLDHRAAVGPGQGLLALGVDRDRDPQAERVRDAAQDAGPVEAVEVLEDQPEAPHHFGMLELGQRRIELRDEQRVVGRQARDEGGIEREVVAGRVAARAGAAVAVEGLVHEQTAPLLDQPFVLESAQPFPGRGQLLETWP